MNRIDHFTLGTHDLTAGQAVLKDKLGVTVPTGSTHDAMSAPNGVCPALCWVVNTPDLDAVVAASPIDLGEVVHFQRGERTWRLTVPQDGSLPEGGLIPAFIEWSPGPHPSTGQQDIGLRLKDILLSHPDPKAITLTLQALGVDHLATVIEGPRALAFEVETAAGTVTLD